MAPRVCNAGHMGQENLSRGVHAADYVGEAHEEPSSPRDILRELVLAMLPGHCEVVALLHSLENAFITALFRVPLAIWREVHRALEDSVRISLQMSTVCHFDDVRFPLIVADGVWALGV